MTSIALGLFIVFILYIMIWSIKNDGVRSIGDQTGFIKMLDPAKTARKLGKPVSSTQRSIERASHPANLHAPGQRKPRLTKSAQAKNR